MSTQPSKSVKGTESENGSGAKPGPDTGSNGSKPKKAPTAGAGPGPESPPKVPLSKHDDTIEDFRKPDSPSAKDAKVTEPAKPAAPKPGGIAPVKDAPAKPGDSTPAWAKPSEPSGSVFADRNDSSPKPFGKREVSGNAPAMSPAMGPGPGHGPGPGPAGGGTATATREKKPLPAKVSSGKAPRKAQLQLSRLEPWSVMKFSFVMSLVCFVVLLVAVVVLYMILSGLGVFDAISDTVNDLTREQGENTGGLDAGSWFSFARIFGYTVLVGALNVLLITALSTVGSVIYNLAADLVGGVEVTLKEAE